LTHGRRYLCYLREALREAERVLRDRIGRFADVSSGPIATAVA